MGLELSGKSLRISWLFWSEIRAAACTLRIKTCWHELLSSSNHWKKLMMLKQSFCRSCLVEGVNSAL